MEYTTVRATIHCDNTGAKTEIPVILTSEGPLQPLVDYLLERAHCKSFSWMQKLVQAVGLLIDYAHANPGCFDRPETFFRNFAQRLYHGTADEYGRDPSGLYWLGVSRKTGDQLLFQLSAFSDWLVENFDVKPLNPWRRASGFEEALNRAAWCKRYHRSLLAHAWDMDHASLSVRRAREILVKASPLSTIDSVKYFPDDRVQELLFTGFIVPGKQKSPRLEERLNLRDILITILMHFGGLRMSEPFHLYVHDVVPDPIDGTKAYVRVFHPSDGQAPLDWRDLKGKPIKCRREAYLRGKYGMRPRDQYYATSQLHAGWKSNMLDSKNHFMNVHWFPQWSGRMFFKLWSFYMVQRAALNCHHPFAFVTEEGKPYAIDSFERAYRRALLRIGMVPAKANGTTPHAHRHAYGQRLARADVDPIFRRKALHHKAIESQTVYTEPDRVRITATLDRAVDRLERNASPPIFFDEAYFNEGDPFNLFRSPASQLGRKT